MNEQQRQLNSRPDDVISLSEILAIILNGKWWIIGSTLLFSLGALFYLWIATPIYSANALVQVESQKSPLGGLVEMSEAFAGESPSEAEIEVIRSRFVLGRVVDSEKKAIVVQPSYFPVIGQAIARRYRPEAEGNTPFNSPLLWLSSFAWGGERIQVDRFTVPEAFQGQPFTLVAGKDGQYQLIFDDQPVLNGRVGEPSSSGATGTPRGIELFVTKLAARPGTEFTLAKQHFITAIDGLGQRLTVSEKGKKTGVLALGITGPERAENRKTLEAIIQRYLRQNVERVSAEAQNSLQFLEDQLPEVRSELELAESRLNRYRLENQTVDLTLETQAILEQAVDIDTELAKLDIQMQQMGQRYTSSHPIMIELKNQRQFLSNRKKEFLGATEDLPQTQQEVLRLARDVQVSTQVYTELLNRAQELKIVKASAVGNVRILDHSLSTIEPVKPKKALIAVLATLLGGMLGMGLVFVRDMLNQGVKTPEEVEAKTGLPVYATVPESEQLKVMERNARKGSAGGFVLARSAPRDLAIESLRSLRTNLAFALMEAPNNRIMLTGPSPDVGKSFVSSNLAELLAESGKKVLLIEADLRKGNLNKVFGVKSDNGLAEMLVNPTLNAIMPVGENLHLIAGGKYPPNPSELLMSPNFTALLEKMSNQYDVVLIDTPPVLAVTDAAIIGEQCGTSFMVVRAELNPAREIEYATRRLQQAGVNVRGAVLNGLVKTASRYGNYGYYQYAYESK
ncbi:polysaccharide biosynthesis tyrosine autokinase [Endozoicomonas acroporae]|uniref:polysaccharide biosynthesis tyrosine autokinase n=1 Tax=Endozoicomonas acroporae TaxID=1701104 RepID=UPI003D7B3DE4